jgi:hypothetical protein
MGCLSSCAWRIAKIREPLSDCAFSKARAVNGLPSN